MARQRQGSPSPKWCRSFKRVPGTFLFYFYFSGKNVEITMRRNGTFGLLNDQIASLDSSLQMAFPQQLPVTKSEARLPF